MLRSITHPAPSSGTVFDSRGFRLRGLEMTRLETFVDAAFAFSITMLALSPDRIPSTFAEMYVLLRGIPAFLFSLGILMLFWNSHVVFSRRFGLEDGPIKLLSALYVAAMLVYVYPLKFMVTMFFSYYFPVLRTPEFMQAATTNDLSVMFIVMSTGFVLLITIDALMYTHALRKRTALGLNEHEQRVTRCEIVATFLHASVGLISVLLALALRKRTLVVCAGYVYAFLGVLIPVYWARFGPTKAQIRDAIAREASATHPRPDPADASL